MGSESDARTVHTCRQLHPGADALSECAPLLPDPCPNLVSYPNPPISQPSRVVTRAAAQLTRRLTDLPICAPLPASTK